MKHSNRVEPIKVQSILDTSITSNSEDHMADSLEATTPTTKIYTCDVCGNGLIRSECKTPRVVSIKCESCKAGHLQVQIGKTVIVPIPCDKPGLCKAIPTRMEKFDESIKIVISGCRTCGRTTL